MQNRISRMRLILHSEGDEKFSIQISGEARQNSILPFYDENNHQLSTIYKCLDNVNLDDLDEAKKDNLRKANLIREGESIITHDEFVKRVGREIFTALFPDKIKQTLHYKLSSGNSDFIHIQIQYDYDSAIESCLHLYPWHLCYSDNAFLSLKSNICFSYLIGDNQFHKPSKKPHKAKLIVIASDAVRGSSSSQNLSTKDFFYSLEEATQSGRDNSLVTVSNVYKPEKDKPTFKSLENFVNSHKEKNYGDNALIIHFFGHGIFKKSCTNRECELVIKGNPIHNTLEENCRECDEPLKHPQGFLQFQESSGTNVDYVNSEKFARQISVLKPKPLLAVVTACNSSLTYDGETVYTGIAQKLIKEGISAVIAFPFRLTQETAESFSNSFYKSLFKKNSTLLEAFKAGVNHCKQGEWYRPLIFLDSSVEDSLLRFESNTNATKKTYSKKSHYNNTYVILERENFTTIIENYKNSCLLSREIRSINNIFSKLDINSKRKFSVYHDIMKPLKYDVFDKIDPLQTPSLSWLEKFNRTDNDIQKYTESHDYVGSFLNQQVSLSYSKDCKFKDKFSEFSKLMSYNFILEQFWWNLYRESSLRHL